MPLVLLIGEGDLAEEVRQALDAAGAEVHRLKGAAEREVRHALDGGGIDKVVVVSRDDAAVLRVALMVRYVDGDVPMLVTIFDPTMAGQVAAEIEHCEVTSMADIVAPSLAASRPPRGCPPRRCRPRRHAADADPPVGIKESGDGIVEVPIEVPKRRRVAAIASAILMPYDKSAALLLHGLDAGRAGVRGVVHRGPRESLGRACALAAVTDDDLENISIAMAAKAVNGDLRERGSSST